jgi:predicted transcriptional regulator
MSTDLAPIPEYTPLSPEDSEIANTYLETMDMGATAKILKITLHQVSEYLNKPVVQKYIGDVFMNTGYRNRLKLGNLLDTLIEKKIEEMAESDLGSSKDILDIIALVAKIRKEELELAIKLEEIKLGRVKRQTNIQINNAPNNPYEAFTKKLLDLDEIV